MDVLLGMSPVSAAALHLGLLIILMLGLKVFVGSRRYTGRIASGDVSDPHFARMGRVQMNAVEDVPVLMIGIVGLAMLGMSASYIHAVGGVLIVSRVLHAWGLATDPGRSFGRAVGTLGTAAVYLAIAGALVTHAFVPPHH